MKLSIIIPVFNEEKTIGKVLKKVISVKLPCQKEIIIVDDGSSDATASEVKSVKLKVKSLKVITHKKNQGKGAAVKSGIKIATGDYILIQDADLEYNPEEIPKLLSPILSRLRHTIRGVPPHSLRAICKLSTLNSQLSTSIAVYGSRFKNKNPQMPKLYLLGNKFLTFLTNLLYGTKLTDMETGYKLLPTSFMKKTKLSSSRFDIEPEITAQLVKNKIPIVEVPISYSGRTHITGKKLTVRDALGAVRTLSFLKHEK